MTGEELYLLWRNAFHKQKLGSALEWHQFKVEIKQIWNDFAVLVELRHHVECGPEQESIVGYEDEELHDWIEEIEAEDKDVLHRLYQMLWRRGHRI